MHQIIHIHADAPLKPKPGSACNGCGVCCLAEPCPLGVLLSGRMQGACHALLWDDTAVRYRCGAVAPATAAAGGLRGRIARLRTKIAVRLIGAGQGCDSDAEFDLG